jgi:hypothetical protein
MDHLLYYAMGLAFGLALGIAVGLTLANEHRNRRILPLAIGISILFGLLLGYALDAYVAFVHASATLPA